MMWIKGLHGNIKIKLSESQMMWIKGLHGRKRNKVGYKTIRTTCVIQLIRDTEIVRIADDAD